MTHNAPDERDLFTRWGFNVDELTSMVDGNPNLRGMLFGYVAELKLSQLLAQSAHISESFKYDDHDRTQKSDRVVIYKGKTITIESKSLQSNSIKQTDSGWTGKAQVDASDRRKVELPDGSMLDTTLLIAGGFDVLAVNCFAFDGAWKWVFCKNADLPTTRYPRYTEAQRKHLIASLVRVVWPPEPPFTEDIFVVLDDFVASAR